MQKIMLETEVLRSSHYHHPRLLGTPELNPCCCIHCVGRFGLTGIAYEIVEIGQLLCGMLAWLRTAVVIDLIETGER